MERAIARAQRCESEPLRLAVLAIAERRAEYGMLNPFMARLQRERIERVRRSRYIPQRETWQRRTRDSLSDRELALLLALSLRRVTKRYPGRVWPTCSGPSWTSTRRATRSAFVCTACGIIWATNDRSCEAKRVRPQRRRARRFVGIDRTVAALRSRPALEDAERRRLSVVYEGAVSGGPSGWLIGNGSKPPNGICANAPGSGASFGERRAQPW